MLAVKPVTDKVVIDDDDMLRKLPAAARTSCAGLAFTSATIIP